MVKVIYDRQTLNDINDLAIDFSDCFT